MESTHPTVQKPDIPRRRLTSDVKDWIDRTVVECLQLGRDGQQEVKESQVGEFI